jgi:hypothetical protein
MVTLPALVTDALDFIDRYEILLTAHWPSLLLGRSSLVESRIR